MENLENLFTELERLENEHKVSPKQTNDSAQNITICSPSPLAPDSMTVILSESCSNKSAFALPPLLSPKGTLEYAEKQLKYFLDPSYVVHNLQRDTNYITKELDQRTSRFLPQLPISKACNKYIPITTNMVTDPFNLTYAFQSVNISNDSESLVSIGNSTSMTQKEEFTRGRLGKKPFSPGGDSIVSHPQKKVELSGKENSELLQTSVEREKTSKILDFAREDPKNIVSSNRPIPMNIMDILQEPPPGITNVMDAKLISDFNTIRQHLKNGNFEEESSREAVVATKEKSMTSLDIYGSQDEEEIFKRIADAKENSDANAKVIENDPYGTSNSVNALSALLQTLDMNEVEQVDDELQRMGIGEDEIEETKEEIHIKEGDEIEHDDDKQVDISVNSVIDTNLDVDEYIAKIISTNSYDIAHSMKTMPPNNQETTWASNVPVDVRNFHAKVPNMAMKYSFELDAFQKQCIIHLENHDCVFVAAHTSAGKTVVAEYAIALSQSHMTRSIYTSPIKALSNQKYRDFREKFGQTNVGLITGDVSINPDAPCLVMTTEILRSMLYKGADIIRDIEYVIFDEIHYINDSERGVVWEEVIIMLPSHIAMVFLSATTPNHFEFSEWIGRTKKQKIHVISTYKRPVPLEHFLYAGSELFKIYDQANGYNSQGYTSAKNKLMPRSAASTSNSKSRSARGGSSASRNTGSSGRTSAGDQSEWMKLILDLKTRMLLPVVVFAFSKKRCEESASKLQKLDLNTPSEKAETFKFIASSLERLRGTDRHLPQVKILSDLLHRGIGIHHGGLLPILKELVELLFGRGLVKVLFATETFAMGVNMPARTVVFNGLRKHDGRTFRNLLPGEYTQMAGRAGRRGLDAVGTVIIPCWGGGSSSSGTSGHNANIPEPTDLFQMLAGKPTALSSQFRLTYTMILNLLRVEVLTVTEMMKRSFSEFHTQKALAKQQIPELINKGGKLLQKLESDLNVQLVTGNTPRCEIESLQGIYDLLQQKVEIENHISKWMLENYIPTYQKALCAGRIITAKLAPRVVIHNALGHLRHLMVLRLNSKANAPDNGSIAIERERRSGIASITVMALRPEELGLEVSEKDVDDISELVVPSTGHVVGLSYAILDMPVENIECITSLEAPKSINFKSLLGSFSKKEIAESVSFLSSIEESDSSSSNKSLPSVLAGANLKLVDVLSDAKVQDLDIVSHYTKYMQIIEFVQTHEYYRPMLNWTSGQTSLLIQIDQIQQLETHIEKLSRQLSNDTLSLMPDFQQRLSVLKYLGYISEENVVQVKGRVACEINTCDELVLTELIFENTLANLEPEEIVAILSALIFQEKSQSTPTLTDRLEETKDAVIKITRSLGLLQMEHRVPLDVNEYVGSTLNFALMEVVYEWARGKSFSHLCELTDIQEGSIVRCITRLDEVCREVRNAARIVGDPHLYRKMEVASEAIKRDVVFAGSLYLT